MRERERELGNKEGKRKMRRRKKIRETKRRYEKQRMRKFGIGAHK